MHFYCNNCCNDARHLLQHAVFNENCANFYFVKLPSLVKFLDVSVVDPNSVVIGLAPSMFNYEKLTEAFNCLKNAENAELIAINKSRYLQRQHGLVLGGGEWIMFTGLGVPDFALR